MDKRVRSFVCLVLFAAFVSCNQGKKQAPVQPLDPDREPVSVTLLDKDLSEIKELVRGRWQLISGENAKSICEYDDTFIEFKDDQYIWIDEDGPAPGELNWRREATPNGYDAFFMDAFYAEYPAFLLAIQEDTLLIQDVTSTQFLYRLVRR